MAPNRLDFSCELSEISNDDVARALARITSRSTYNHALVAARIFFNWCIKRRYIEHNPTTGLSPHSTMPRARLLTDQDIKFIWQATEEPTIFNTIVRLLLLTGQRRNEIASLKSSWIKENSIVLPASITKNKREHHFPISSLAISILKSHIPSVSSKDEIYLFPARGKQNACFNGWSKSKSALDRRLGGTVEPWTLHDIRRYFSSTMARLGVRLEVTERLRNHISGTQSGVAGIYNRYSYETEIRAAVDLYQKYLQKLFEDTIAG